MKKQIRGGIKNRILLEIEDDLIIRHDKDMPKNHRKIYLQPTIIDNHGVVRHDCKVVDFTVIKK